LANDDVQATDARSEDNYGLEHRGGRYKITPTGIDGGQIELDENWIIQEIRSPIPGERFTVSMQPHYAKNPNGLLLSSLDVRNMDEPSQWIQMTIEYREWEDLKYRQRSVPKASIPAAWSACP